MTAPSMVMFIVRSSTNFKAASFGTVSGFVHKIRSCVAAKSSTAPMSASAICTDLSGSFVDITIVSTRPSGRSTEEMLSL